MLIKNLPFEAILFVEFTDPVHRVLSLMQDAGVSHLAVQREEKFAGIISEDVLLEANEEMQIEELKYILTNDFVKEDEHFLKAVALAADRNLSIIPVVNEEGNLTATIPSSQLLKYVADFLHLQEPGAMIVLEINPQHFSFSEISKIIESNDARVTQLNTSRNPDSGSMLVTIKINKLEISDIVSTFQRYDYNVVYYSGEELYTNELKSNYENLMNYLNI